MMKRFIKKSVLLLVAGAMTVIPVTMPAQVQAKEVGIQSVYSYGVITANGVKMRSTPSSSGTALALLDKGERVQIISVSSGWCYCQTTSGIRGYVASQYVSGIS